MVLQGSIIALSVLLYRLIANSPRAQRAGSG
jgi:hypothetical protein